MHTFYLNRLEDATGVSGTGRVAEGVQFSNGWCALTWLTEHTSMAFYASIEDVEAIHGHDGRTQVVWEGVDGPVIEGTVEEAIARMRSSSPAPRPTCESCTAAHQTSHVYVHESSSTLLGARPYYDEQGGYHAVNPNTVTTRYSCSNGHAWTHTVRQDAMAAQMRTADGTLLEPQEPPF